MPQIREALPALCTPEGTAEHFTSLQSLYLWCCFSSELYTRVYLLAVITIDQGGKTELLRFVFPYLTMTSQFTMVRREGIYGYFTLSLSA